MDISRSYQLLTQIHITCFCTLSVCIVTVATAVYVAVHLATRDNDKRSVAYRAADVAATEEISRDSRATFHDDQAIIIHIIHATSAINGIAHHGIGYDHRSVRRSLICAAQAHHTTHVVISAVANSKVLACGHGTSVATTIDGAHLPMQQDNIRH